MGAEAGENLDDVSAGPLGLKVSIVSAIAKCGHQPFDPVRPSCYVSTTKTRRVVWWIVYHVASVQQQQYDS